MHPADHVPEIIKFIDSKYADEEERSRLAYRATAGLSVFIDAMGLLGKTKEEASAKAVVGIDSFPCWGKSLVDLYEAFKVEQGVDAQQTPNL